VAHRPNGPKKNRRREIPILSRDFDGVLRSVGEPVLDEDFRPIENLGFLIGRPILEEKLVQYPAVRIIVSSDWRRPFDDALLVRLLGPLPAMRVQKTAFMG
jgi:hypothetical protein